MRNWARNLVPDAISNSRVCFSEKSPSWHSNPFEVLKFNVVFQHKVREFLLISCVLWRHMTVLTNCLDKVWRSASNVRHMTNISFQLQEICRSVMCMCTHWDTLTGWKQWNLINTLWKRYKWCGKLIIAHSCFVSVFQSLQFFEIIWQTTLYIS